MQKAKTDIPDSAPVAALRQFALRFPEAEDGTSCVSRAFRARNKAFLYVGMKGDHYSVMLKLGDSLAEAASLQATRPDHYQVGMHGWTNIRLPRDEFAPAGRIEAWIEESYRLLAPNSLVEKLPANGLAGTATKQSRKRASAQRRAPKRADKKTRPAPKKKETKMKNTTARSGTAKPM